MIVDAFLDLVTGLLTSLYNSLPPWTITLGGTNSDASDQGIITGALYYVGQFDKYLPIHDGYATWMTIICSITLAFFVYRFVLLVVNAVRGSGAR